MKAVRNMLVRHHYGYLIPCVMKEILNQSADTQSPILSCKDWSHASSCFVSEAVETKLSSSSPLFPRGERFSVLLAVRCEYREENMPLSLQSFSWLCLGIGGCGGNTTFDDCVRDAVC